MNSTRKQLLDTAEKLFLENGPDEVSLRSIVREAGQKNQSALQYHFGGREGLVKAMLERRLQQVDEKRQQLIAESGFLADSHPLRDICALMVRAPFLLCREQAEFKTFLGRFGQQLLNSELDIDFSLAERDLASLQALQRLLQVPLEQLDPALVKLRVENTQSLVLLVLSRRARLGGSFRGRQAELFFNNLVDQVAAMLSASVDEATASALSALSPGDTE